MNLRKFLWLLANGATLEKMADKVAKSYVITKEAAEAVRQLRLENGISEQAVMTALGLTDVNEYVSWESGTASLELSADNFTALAKVLKTDIATLAAKMVSADGPDPKLDDNNAATDGTASTGANGNAGGNQSETPGSSVPGKSADGKKTAAEIAKEKQAGGSHQAKIIQIDKGVNVNTGGSELEKAERTRQLRKSILGLDDKAIAKGNIVAEDFSPNNALNPELANQLISVLVDQSEWLKQIQVKPMARQSQEVMVWDIQGRKMGRSAPGWPTASDLQKGINKSKLLNATKCTLSWFLENRTMMNYQNNIAGLETEVVNGFTQTLRNDMVDLSWNGQTDNWDTIVAASGTPAFTDLGIGYLKLAQTLAPGAQVLSITANDAVYDNGNHLTGNIVPQKVMDLMIKTGFAQAPRFFTDTTPLQVGVTDWAYHESLLLNRNDATPVLVNGIESKYRGRPVSQSNYIATKNYIQTQLQNYILGIVTGTQGSDGIVIERHIMPQGVLYVAIVYLDFAFVNTDALICAMA